ncbi:hypothetical protein E2C01_040684 [Portunus trituberculatus]|uniref:Uncharacterized protein n=1 Tax=Portunus trituberculatus TaxID=210409 RepID=A0A5B7FKG1_PORTR|nr:hypothetical protein [Portunus trituberculatus]
MVENSEDLRAWAREHCAYRCNIQLWNKNENREKGDSGSGFRVAIFLF